MAWQCQEGVNVRDSQLEPIRDFEDAIRVFRDSLPKVFPYGEHSSALTEWQDRLSHEVKSVQRGIDIYYANEPDNFANLGPPSKDPPWSRQRPVANVAFRSDGKRVRDGGGVGSPLIVDPARAVSWPDPLARLRSVLLLVVRESNVGSSISECLSACSSLARLEESPPSPRVSKLIEVGQKAYHDMQMRLRDVVKVAADAALRRLLPLRHVLVPGFPCLDFSIPDGQPFRLRFISSLAAACGDVDFQFPLTCEEGVVLGDVDPLPDCEHFPVKSDHVDFSVEPITWSSNYKSAEQAPEIVKDLLTEDLAPENSFAKGPFTWHELLVFLDLPLDTPEPAPDSPLPQFCGGIAVMRLGCVDESLFDDAGVRISAKYRLVCDGTASGVNGRVRLPCVAETPTLLDGEALFSVPCPDVHMVGMKVDVKGAFKRVKLRRDQFSHAVFQFLGMWYVYVVLPFGMKASAFHWVRMYSVIHRILKRVLQCYFHGSLMYIDDSLYAACASQANDVFGIILVLLTVLGVPISWKKIFLGTLLDWVGFRIDFMSQRVFLSTVRLAKLRAQMDDIDRQARVSVSAFRKLTFRMVWACQCFPMAKVFLHHFFATLCSSMAATGFIYRVAKLAEIFALWHELIRAASVWDSAVVRDRLMYPDAITRTDAMASSDGIFVAGWTAASPQALARGDFQWFAFELSIEFFPEAKASPNRVISAAEAAAVALAIAAFGGVLVESDSMVTVLSNKKWHSGSRNLAFAMLQIVRSACHWRFRPSVVHVSGKDNALADALSRMHVDPAAAALMGRCPAALRVPIEVFLNVLPDFEGYLSIPPMAGV